MPFCEALLMSCTCVNRCFASSLKVKGILFKECKGNRLGVGGGEDLEGARGQNVNSAKTNPS